MRISTIILVIVRNLEIFFCGNFYCWQNASAERFYLFPCLELPMIVKTPTQLNSIQFNANMFEVRHKIHLEPTTLPLHHPTTTNLLATSRLLRGAIKKKLPNMGHCPNMGGGSAAQPNFLIWTYVARTNAAWTNVTLTVGICSKCSQEPTFKVSSKSGQ